MARAGTEPRALFLFRDEAPQPDAEVCSGRYRDWLEGAACPYADAGRIPLAGSGEPLPGAGRPPGDITGGALGFPCALAQLGRLAEWRGEIALRFPPELGRLTLCKCKQMFLLVVLGEEAAS